MDTLYTGATKDLLNASKQKGPRFH